MVNHCSWQSNQTQITFKCHEMRYLISFLKKTHNYKQLSVASVLLTADYDGPQRAACRKIIRYPQSYSINPKNSWNALAWLWCWCWLFCLWHLGEPKVKWHLSRDGWFEAFVFKCRRRLNLISYWTSAELFACLLIIPTGFCWKKHQTTLRWF